MHLPLLLKQVASGGFIEHLSSRGEWQFASETGPDGASHKHTHILHSRTFKLMNERLKHLRGSSKWRYIMHFDSGYFLMGVY